MRNILRSAAVFGVGCFGLGLVIAIRYRAPNPSSALMIAGAIIIAGTLIAAAITHVKK